MNVIFISILAGVLGMGLGGLLTAVAGSRTDKSICILLSFAGGVMTSIVFFELIPDAMAHTNTAIAIAGLAIGVLMVLALHYFVDKFSDNSHITSKLHGTLKEFYHESGMLSSQNSMIRSGMVMLFAIGLHNLPEGIAIGTAGSHDISLGLTLALLIGVHNIPEGMAISAPLISGGFGKWKTVLLTLLSGVPTVLGALVGEWIGVSDIAIALSYSIAGGAMLYAVFGEILPQSMVMRNDRMPTIVLLVGITFGLLLTKI